jgi:hypothetical protein
MQMCVCVHARAGSKKLVAFITGVPARLRVRGSALAMVEINFLCVHKKLRHKRLAPVLIKVGLKEAAHGAPDTAGRRLPPCHHP